MRMISGEGDLDSLLPQQLDELEQTCQSALRRLIDKKVRLVQRISLSLCPTYSFSKSDCARNWRSCGSKRNDCKNRRSVRCAWNATSVLFWCRVGIGVCVGSVPIRSSSVPFAGALLTSGLSLIKLPLFCEYEAMNSAYSEAKSTSTHRRRVTSSSRTAEFQGGSCV